MESAICLSCGGSAFRTDRPYGDFCSMMCALRGVLTDAEKKEETEKIKLYIKNWKAANPEPAEAKK